MGVGAGDSGRGAEPHIRWLVTQILSNFAVAAPGEWIPAVSVGSRLPQRMDRSLCSAKVREPHSCGKHRLCELHEPPGLP